MNDQRWLAGAVLAIGGLLLARSTIIVVGGYFLLDIGSRETIAEHRSTMQLLAALGIANLLFGLIAVVSGIGLWRRAAWAQTLWFATAWVLIASVVVLIIGTDVPWADYVAEAFVATWSLVHFIKQRGKGSRAL